MIWEGMSKNTMTPEISLLERLTQAVERLARTPTSAIALTEGITAYVWHKDGGLIAVPTVSAVPFDILQGISQQKEILLRNTEQFAKGFSANNALLWGARGMGKSSLVKAIHGHLQAQFPTLTLVEIHREELGSMPGLLNHLRAIEDRRFILYCDDLSFDHDDAGYKSLKAVLEGGLEGRPENVLFYATSNRRHLMPRDMMENERASGINPSEAVEEKVSLSDRFGLWLGFHSCTQDDFFDMLDAYVAQFDLQITQDELRARAIEWSMTRGSRSGRVAWQFIQDLAGELGKPIKF